MVKKKTRLELSDAAVRNLGITQEDIDRLCSPEELEGLFQYLSAIRRVGPIRLEEGVQRICSLCSPGSTEDYSTYVAHNVEIARRAAAAKRLNLDERPDGLVLVDIFELVRWVAYEVDNRVYAFRMDPTFWALLRRLAGRKLLDIEATVEPELESQSPRGVAPEEPTTELQDQILAELTKEAYTAPEMNEHLSNMNFERSLDAVKVAFSSLMKRGLVQNKKGKGYFLTLTGGDLAEKILKRN